MSISTTLGGSALKSTTELTPVVYKASSYVGAQADVVANVADTAQLTGGVLCHDGRVQWPGHGLTVGEWYYLDQSTSGGYITPAPTSGIVQQLFFVEDENHVQLDIEEAYSVDVAKFVVRLETDADRLALTDPQDDTIYVVKDSDGLGNNESWVYDLTDGWQVLDDDPASILSYDPLTETLTYTNDDNVVNTIDLSAIDTNVDAFVITQTGDVFDFDIAEEGVTLNQQIDLSAYQETVTPIVTGNPIATFDDGEGGLVNIQETVTSLRTDGTDIVFDKENGSEDRIPQLIPFTIAAYDQNAGVVGQIGMTYQPSSFNVNYGPLTWSLDSFSGDVQNVTVDPATGEVTYDATATLANNGRGQIVIFATDQIGQVQYASTLVKLADPSSTTTLACNANLAANLPAVQAKLVFDGRIRPVGVFTDLAKTTLAVDGDTVEVWEDGTGNGDVTVRSGDVGPTLVANGAPNGNLALSFSGSNQALQYDVPSAPTPGSAFKLVFLAQLSAAGASNNATVIASTFQANNNSTGTGSWQVSRSNNGAGFFAFRTNGGIILSGADSTGGSGIDMILSTWSTMTDGNWHLVAIDYDGTTATGFFDGAEVFQVQPNEPLAAEHFKFFENRAGSDYVQGSLAELTYANNTVSVQEFTQIQAYYLCKFGLDASLISDPGPFAVEDNFYGQSSQFQYQVLSDGTEVVYDVTNNVYYDPSDVPTPGLGYFLDPALRAIRDGQIQDAIRVGNDIVFTKGDGSTQTASVLD